METFKECWEESGLVRPGQESEHPEAHKLCILNPNNMIQAKTRKSPVPEFIYDNQENMQTNNLVATCWSVAVTCLWDECVLSAAEKEIGQAAIRNLLLGAKDMYREAVQFCERVLLARNYVRHQEGRYVPLPSVWFATSNEKGYEGTQRWYDRLLSLRRSLPLYKIEHKAFAEGVLEMREEPTVANYCYWKNYFLEKRSPSLLQLFMCTVANGFFDNASGTFHSFTH